MENQGFLLIDCIKRIFLSVAVAKELGED